MLKTENEALKRAPSTCRGRRSSQWIEGFCNPRRRLASLRDDLIPAHFLARHMTTGITAWSTHKSRPEIRIRLRVPDSKHHVCTHRDGCMPVTQRFPASTGSEELIATRRASTRSPAKRSAA